MPDFSQKSTEVVSRHRNMSASSSSDRQRKAYYPRSCWELALRIMCVSSERDWRLIKVARQPAPSSLLPSVTTASGTGGDKTDTPTDMLHKEAQVAFKILMTH